MTVEQALKVVQRVLNQRRLTKVEELVFCQCWEKQSYLEIAKSCAYQVVM